MTIKYLFNGKEEKSTTWIWVLNYTLHKFGVTNKN